jgi:putative restriction endonuclease
MSAAKVNPVSTDDLDSWERKIEQGVVNDPSIPETDRLAIIRARKGQGLFKERVGKIEAKCWITGVESPVHLVASHCKPWRDSTNEERLDGENGLLPSIDHLFDRGFIGFENNGVLIISPVAHRPSFKGWVSTPQRPSMWARSPAVKSSSLISTGTRCSCNLSAASIGGRTAAQS